MTPALLWPGSICDWPCSCISGWKWGVADRGWTCASLVVSCVCVRGWTVGSIWMAELGFSPCNRPGPLLGWPVPWISFWPLHFLLVLGIRGGGGGGASGGDSKVEVSVEIRTLRLRLNMCRLDKAFWDWMKRGLMKQRAPRSEPQFSSLGLRVVIGQNSLNRVALGPDCLVAVSGSGAASCWLPESGWAAESGWDAICGAVAGGAGVTVSGFFFLSLWGLGASRGPRTFRWELQNSINSTDVFFHYSETMIFA